MKIVIIGAQGTIGKKVQAAVGANNEIITVGKKSGQYQVDITRPASIGDLFEKIGSFDALIATAGDVAFAPLLNLTPEQWSLGVQSKFLGQVNLVQIGLKYIKDGGSFTLTSGILSDEFIMAGTSATAINRAIEGFVQASASELAASKKGVRINVVSPGMLEESKAAYGVFFPGHIAVAGSRVAEAYKRSVFGIESGKIFKVF